MKGSDLDQDTLITTNMSTLYPNTIDTAVSIPIETANTALATNHIPNHESMRGAIIELETKLGVNGSTDTNSIDSKLNEVTGVDKVVGKTATQVLSNKTLGSGTKMAIGSDATGDMYYRDSAGNLARLAAVEGKIVKFIGGAPVAADEQVVVDASYAAKGTVQFQTDAATSGISVTAGVASLNTGTTANKIVKLDGSAKLPAVDGSQLTGVNPTVGLLVPVGGTTTTTVTHNLGVIPRYAYVRGIVGYSTGKSHVTGYIRFNNSTGAVISQNVAAYNYDSNGGLVHFLSDASSCVVVKAATTILYSQAGASSTTSFTLTHGTAGGGYDLYIEVYA